MLVLIVHSQQLSLNPRLHRDNRNPSLSETKFTINKISFSSRSSDSSFSSTSDQNKKHSRLKTSFYFDSCWLFLFKSNSSLRIDKSAARSFCFSFSVFFTESRKDEWMNLTVSIGSNKLTNILHHSSSESFPSRLKMVFPSLTHVWKTSSSSNTNMMLSIGSTEFWILLRAVRAARLTGFNERNILD